MTDQAVAAPGLRDWQLIDTAPEHRVVLTKIHDEHGERNVQPLRRQGRLWLTDDWMYVYYTPTHWRELGDPDRQERP